jgi:hypothetical protein
LINRLLPQRESQTSPDIYHRPIIAPLFITGLPRTGTTLLHGLAESYLPETVQARFGSAGLDQAAQWAKKGPVSEVIQNRSRFGQRQAIAPFRAVAFSFQLFQVSEVQL